MNVERTIIALEEQALLSVTRGHHSEAIQAHYGALTLAREVRRPRLTAVLLHRLGQSLEATGQVQSAIDVYVLGLEMLADDGDQRMDELLNALPLAAGKSGPDNELGGTDLVEPLDDAEADPALPFKLLLDLGDAYLRQSQDTLALQTYQSIPTRPEIDRAPAMRAHALVGIGLVQRRRGDVAEAYASLGEALDMLDRLADPVEKRRALAIMAGIHRDRGQSELSLCLYRQSLALYRRAEDACGEARTRAGLGHLLLAMEQPAEARRSFERASALLTHDSEQDIWWHVHWGLGRCLLTEGEPAQAAQAFQRCLDLIGMRRMELRTDEGKVPFVDSVQDIFDGLIEAYLKLAEIEGTGWEPVLAVIEEARERALYDLMGSRRRKRLPEGKGTRKSRLRPFADRTQDMPSQAVPVASAIDEDDPSTATPSVQKGQETPAERSEDGHPATGDQTALVRSDRFDTFTRAPRAASGESESSVGTPEFPPLARLVFHVLVDQVAVLTVSPQGAVRGHAVPWNRDELVKRVRILHHALQIDGRLRGISRVEREPRETEMEFVDYFALLAEWYDTLISPIADALPDDGTPVAVEPHGALWLLPFAALIDEKGDWLADRWPLLYTPSWQTLDEIRKEPDYGGPNDLKALIVGDPMIPPLRGVDLRGLRLEPLPGTRDEARETSVAFPDRNTLLTGQRAERAGTVPLMGEHGILHLATHSIARGDSPMASFVLLGGSEDGGGLLTALQITSLALPADLVTLSACQAVLGKGMGSGIIALSRSFLIAGARTVLLSQWNASERATARLMKSFYHWYVARDDKALALQAAMRELRARPGYEHPRFWAPFVVVGAET